MAGIVIIIIKLHLLGEVTLRILEVCHASLSFCEPGTLHAGIFILISQLWVTLAIIAWSLGGGVLESQPGMERDADYILAARQLQQVAPSNAWGAQHRSTGLW